MNLTACSCSLRTDPLIGLGANVALILSGQYVKWVSNLRRHWAPGVDEWAVTLKYLMGAVLASGGLMLGIYKYMLDKIVPKVKAEAALLRNSTGVMGSDESNSAKKNQRPKKKKMSMTESVKFLWNSQYIRDLAVLVISCGMTINIVEVSWKAKLKQAFPDPNSYSAFMGSFSTATGVVTLVMMVLGRYILETFGWRKSALITPTVSFLPLQSKRAHYDLSSPRDTIVYR